MEGIVETQASLDEPTVKEYIDLIESGVEPITIILICLNSINKFVLDGHHKFLAYHRLKKQPKALIITKLQCEKINRQRGLNLFEICKCHNSEYKNRFLQRVKD